MTGIARAHKACGREILVTSTAALAAQRLTSVLAEKGVSFEAFSTPGLYGAISAGRFELGHATTAIHDEAARAGMREQIRLLREVEALGRAVASRRLRAAERWVGRSGLSQLGGSAPPEVVMSCSLRLQSRWAAAPSVAAFEVRAGLQLAQ